MSVSAELIEDRGELACESEFFRSRGFFDAEGVTHTLALRDADSGSETYVPLVVRTIPQSPLIDAVSPYSYPSARRDPADAPPVDPSDVDWAPTGLVSVFVRDRVGGEACFSGATDRSLVYVSDPTEPRKSRPSDRRQVRRNAEDGYTVRSCSGPNAADDGVDELTRVYLETMERIGASERYKFDRSYFATLLSVPDTWLVEVLGPEGDVAAAAIAARSDQMIHYYLSGTAEAHARNSPSKNLIFAVIELAEKLELPMNLGGGVQPGDALESFKRGFGNRELPYRTHELICDPAAYERLVDAREEPVDSESDDSFFPAYRRP